jgi:beta-glucanase (GH16 family)
LGEAKRKLNLIDMKKLLALFILFAAVNQAQNYQLVWSDEFSDATINTSNWTHETGGTGWGNNELEFYTSRSVNSYIQNGSLVIEAKKENYGGKNYTSARMITKGKRYFTYGKIEARIKLPYGKGIWPAFWTLGENISTVGWPACGEIDIVELIGGGTNDKKVYGTAHWESNGHAQYGGSYTLSSGIFADNYHVFSITWTSTKIDWFVDGIKYVTIDITPAGLQAFHKNNFIILNLAVGGNWPGNPDSTTVFPQKMYVDYVRVYQDAPTSANEEENDLPEKFILENNFPNPFNPETIISYQIAPQNLSSKSSETSVFVSLKVYDMLGHEIAALVNEEQQIGKYSIKFDAANNALPSGIYFYQLRAGDFIQTKKMILMR